MKNIKGEKRNKWDCAIAPEVKRVTLSERQKTGAFSGESYTRGDAPGYKYQTSPR
jgi:hypothetical protein